jgi:hypothetical protein
MAGLTLNSGISSIFPTGTTHHTWREAQVAHHSRGRTGGLGAGIQPAG